MVNRRFPENESLGYYQQLMNDIYRLPGDRNFSLPDILSQQQRFTMRALKGIRKGDHTKLTLNLLNAFSWVISLANRLHFDVEELVWHRFPMLCSYCGHTPCQCRKMKPASRIRINRVKALRPKRLSDFQRMFASIYPAETRTLEHVGVHLGEETGEVSEAVHAFLAEHQKSQLEEVQSELADCVSCIFGVANSAGIDIAKGLARMFSKNCFVCHLIPCECTVSSINKFKS